MVVPGAVLGLILTVGLAAPVGANTAPIVDSFTASPPSVAPDGTVDLSLAAHDPDCAGTCTSGCGLYVRADLTNWSATGGSFASTSNGVSGSPYTASAQWQAPTVEGTYTVTVQIGDSGSFLCGGRMSTIETVDIFVTNNPNLPPVIEDVTAQPALLLPGESALLTCVASDSDEDPLSYGWSAVRGSVSPGAGGGATYTAPLTEVGIDTITCSVSDGTVQVSDTVEVSVVGAQGEKALIHGLVAPQRLAADTEGNLYVVDTRAGGLAVINLFSEKLIYRLPLAELTSVAVDWNQNLLLGGPLGADVRNRAGQQLVPLLPGSSLGDVSDVAVDLLYRRYGVLYRSAGRVVVFDEFGAQVMAFGSTGTGPAQLRSPQGLAATPQGNWVVADRGNGKIKVFDPAGNLLTAFGTPGGAAGEWIQLDDVEVDPAGVIWASDAYQSWVQSFDPNGSLRETLGHYGDDMGQFRTPRGITWVRGIPGLDGFTRLVVASANSSSLQVFRPDNNSLPGPPPAPIAQLEPGALTFPQTGTGQTSPPQIVTLSNAGNALLGVTRILTQGSYAQANNCGSFVEAASSCTISVTFQPTSAGDSPGQLLVETTAQSSTVPLSGQGFVPAGVELVPASLGFSDQEIGTVSDPRLVTLTNTGSVPLEILSIEASADYFVNSDCPGSLAAAASCTLEVRFTPGTVADHIYGAVTVVSSATGSPHVVALDGSGIPTIPRFSVSAVAAGGVDEGDDGDPVVMQFEVTLSPPPPVVAYVHYQTVAGTATEGEDFQSMAAMIEFQPGETSQIVSVPLVGDGILEPEEETFTLELWGPLAALIDDASAIGTIVDDEVCLSPVLVGNPGAETLSGASRIPGWIEKPGPSWQIRSLSPQPQEGIAYFAAGDAPYTELVQEVDMEPFADPIDAASQFVEFSAWLRSAEDDTARVVVEYRNWDRTLVLDRYDSGAISSSGAWQQVQDLRLVPPDTRWLQVRLIGQRNYGPTNDAFFDAISLRSIRAATVLVDDFSAYEGGTGTSSAFVSVELACPYYQAVSVLFETEDDTALAGEDYAATSGMVVLEPGQTEMGLTVDLYGDDADEGHESFFVNLQSVDPIAAVRLTEQAVGTILDDDFCPLPAPWWAANADLLPDWLALGEVVYGWQQVADFLGYHGKDVATEVARELSATKLNLSVGSPPTPVFTEQMDLADQYLLIYPPGSVPKGPARREGLTIRDTLQAYNEQLCVQGESVTGQGDGLDGG